MGEISSPSSAQNKLSLLLFWDSFLSAESKSYERAVWLDGFLAEYLLLLKDGQNVNNILPSSCSVAALVACELLSDVHETCSQLGNDDNLSALKKYLLCGRGWRFLAVLRSLKLQDVSCSKELATLLFSLFSVNVEESKVEDRARNPYVQELAVSDISEYVNCLKLPSRRKHMIPNVGSTENSCLSPKNRKISNASRRQAKSSPAENQEKRNEQDILSTESEALSVSLATTKSSNIRMRIDPMDFDYFQSYIRSEDDVRKDSASYCPSEPAPRRTCKPNPEALFDDRIHDVFKQKVNFFEFKILVVDILKKLAMSENLNPNDCSDVNESITFRTLMFALEKLCDLQFGSSAVNVQKPGHCATLKSALVRLLLTSLSRFLTICDITPAVMQNGIVPMMKKLLEDAISKCESSEVPSNYRAVSEDVDIIFSVLYGLIILFHRLLLHNNSSLEKLGQFLSLLGRFSDSRSGKLVDRAIDIILGPGSCNSETSVERVKQILISVSRLVTALKRTRSKIVHSRLCKRNRHKHCSLWSISYHHDLVFGEVYSQSLISPNFSYNCCVSSLFMSLCKCLSFDQLVVYTLQAMMSCGGCCCFPSPIIVAKLLDLVSNSDAKIRCVAFMFFEKTLYRQMGALRPVEQLLSREGADISSKCCQVCPERVISLVDSHEAAAESILGKKSSLDTFCDLLLSDDLDLSHAVSSHLLRVVPRCRPEIQKEMLFDIFYPVFISAKTTYTNERSDSSKFLLLTCLSAFTNLLVTVKFMEQFLSMSGLNHIEDLMYEPDFIKPCCAVIEIAILVQVVSWDVSGLESEVLRDNEISMSNLDILLKYVNNSTELLLQNVLKLECESSNGESPLNSGASFAIRRFLDKFFPDSCSPSTNSFSMINQSLEATTTDDWDRFRCLLEQCMVLWRTCTNICIYSPQMRKYFSRHPISQQSFDLLCMTLDQIGLHTNVGGTKCSEISEKLFSANQDTIKLFESLLILNIIAPTLDANSGTLMTIESVMSALKEKLLTALNNGNVSARHLCDVLLRASTLLPSEKIVIPQHKMPKLGDGMTLSDGQNSEPSSNFVLTDFDEVMSSPNSTPELSADEGYEADVDVPERNIVENVDAINGNSSSTEGSRKLSVVDSRRDLIVTYPGLCNVVVQMLAHYLNGSDEEDCEPGLFSAKLADSVYCIQRLGSLCQDSDENCFTLSGQNFIAQLLRQFQRFIGSANPQYLGIQQAVLTVISHIAQRNIEAKELSQLLQLFTADKPSLDPLLVCLNRIVSNVRSQPQCFANFPTNCKEEEMVPSATLDPAEKMAMSLRSSHTASGIESSWSKSAVILPINQELGWSMWASGMSLSMWFCVNKPISSLSHRSSVVVFESDAFIENQGAGTSNYSRSSRPTTAVMTAGLLHLVSIGYETLTLEFWIYPLSDTLIVRLNRLDVDVQEVLVEKKIDLHLTSGVWQHLAINVKDNFQKRKVNLQVTLIFNGCHEVPVELSFVGLLIRKSRCTCLLVGHNNNNSSSSSSSSSSSTLSGGWQLGNLLMFRCPVFSKEKATCLMAYGPDHCYLIETEVGNTRPSMASVFSKGPLSANIDWDAILNNQSDMMRELQESLLLVYSARSPQSVCVYPQVLPNNTGVVGSLLASQVGFRVVAVDGRAAQQLPMCLSPAVVAPSLHATFLHSFHLASNSIGGVSLFLFLFARVVELEASEETQARALLLLLKVVNSNAEFYSQFFSQEQDHLLTLVLTSARCKLGLHMLKAILDVCCDRPGLLVHQQVSSCQFQVSGQSRALLVDGALVAATVLACWRGWQRSGCLATVLQLLLVLLRDDHPRREFNLAQLSRIDTLRSLLTFCKERFEDSAGVQDREVCGYIVELVQSLMSAPPRHEQIESVMKFLVLAHPADLTYITHLWSSFYFVLAAKRPHILQRPNFITSARLNILAQSSSDKAEKMKKNRSFLAGNYSSASSSDKNGASLAVDPQKLNKALANLQIKEETSNREEEIWVQEVNCDSGIAGSFRDYSDLENPLPQPEKVRTASKEYRSMNTKSVDFDVSGSSTSEIVEGEIYNQKLPKIDENSHSDSTEKVKIFQIADFSPETPDIKNERCKTVTEPDRASDLVTEGLLNRLHDIILVLPDSNAQIVLERIVKIEALLIMANHPNSKIRVAVIKIVSAYLQRATDEELSRFLRLKGFQLLANQLFAYEVTSELAEAVVTLLTGRHWLPLEEQLVGDCEPVAVSPLQMAALPTLLALLPKAADSDNCRLTAELVAFVERFFNKVPQAFRALTDAGILEVLLKTLLAVAHSSSNEIVTDSSQGTVLNAIHSFLIAIVSQTVQGVGNYYIQVMNDLIALFNCLEKQERHDCDDKSRCVYVLRAAHCTLLETALAVIQNKINFQQPLVARIRSSATAFFNNVFQANFEDYVVDSGRYRRSSSSSLSSSPGGVGGGPNSLVSPFAGMAPDKTRLTHNDLVDRFRTVITKSVEFVTNNVPIDGKYCNLSTLELHFIRRLFSCLMGYIVPVVDRKSVPRTSWNNTMWTARETIRNQTAKLLIWMLSPAHHTKVRLAAVNAIRNEPKAQDIVLFVLDSNQVEENVMLFMWDLVNGQGSDSLSEEQRSDCVDLCDRLQAWGLKSEMCLTGICEEDVSLAWEKDMLEQKIWWKAQEANAYRCLLKMEGIVKSVSECALSVMKTVTDDQNCERKQLMDRIRTELSERVHTQIVWKTVVRQLTHERAVWYSSKSYPRSWQLDPTEGPARIRIRLQRCHLSIKKKFMKPQFRYKTDSLDVPQPLSYLFDSEGRTISSMSAFLIEKLHTDQKIQHMATARVITPALEVPGELLIGETCVYFIPSSSGDEQEEKKEENEGSDEEVNNTPSNELNAGALDMSAQAWQFEEIKEIHTRRFQLKEQALEIFLLNGKTFLLAFQSSSERDEFQNQLLRCELSNRVASDNLLDAVQLWREGQLTNWEYLMTLNKMAGRTYNDLMQYPILPFVLSAYNCHTIDLSDPANYRNLEKPMAVQNKANEQHYIKHYNYFKQEMPVGSGSTFSGPYHYGSHYSNSGSVLHFLVRLPPFTSMFLQYQDKNFDLPDRTFHCLETTWRLSSRESTTDVKELLPEFFFLPEFLTNIEGFDFGVRQNGERVDNVTLPKWAFADPRRFILIHRQALESDYVRENLPHWIDLVFGYKQTGKAAVDAVNVFHPATYYGFDVETIDDPLVRTAWETMVRTYGQTPRQLFKLAHPMVVQSLAPKPDSPSIQGVKGLQWGSYVGSPTEAAPTTVLHQHHRTPVARLVPLLTNDVFGLAPQTTLLLAYSKEKTLSLVSGGGMCIHGAALISWGHPEGVLRLKGKKEQAPDPVIRPPASAWDSITNCTSVPDSAQLWIGYSSGRILVYRYRFIVGKNTVEFAQHPEVLVGHTQAILSLAMSHEFSIAVSGSQDGSSIIWDMNRVSYVQSLPDISMPIALASISSTLGDIVTVGQDTQSNVSTLRLHSINATFLGSITTQKQITAVCFSNAQEGVSINVIATGMQDGSVKLWSTWDLSPVCEITSTSLTQSIISLTYSHDSQHLYASAGGGSGYVVVWQNGSSKSLGSKLPKYLNLTNLI